jgi:prevent-host-death family protein
MIGVRQLRADLAAHVRRAAAGEVTVVSIAGRPAAVLAPLMPADHAGATAMAALLASGAVLAPRRTDRRPASGTVTTWANVRLDRLLREIRG